MLNNIVEYETCVKGMELNCNDIFSYCLDCYMKQDCTYYDISYVGKLCEHFGNRLLDYPKCGSCHGEICENCSILTLQKVLREHPRRIDVITTTGFKIVVGEGGVKNEN